MLEHHNMDEYNFEWPLGWLLGWDLDSFCTKILYRDDEPNPVKTKKLDWRQLISMSAWESSYLRSLDCFVPEKPGIYVVAHDEENAPLYVGKAENLKARVLSKQHHKIPKIIEIYSRETGYPIYHDTSRVEDEVIVFWKVVNKPYYNNSLEKTLIWYEAIAIGMLCPIMQGKLDNIEKQEWAIGTRYFC